MLVGEDVTWELLQVQGDRVRQAKRLAESLAQQHHMAEMLNQAGNHLPLDLLFHKMNQWL